MANLTRTQLRKRIRELIEQAENLKSDLEEIQSEAEDERDSIEPYDGKDELTEQQEERQGWFECACDQIDYALDNIDEFINNLEEIDCL